MSALYREVEKQLSHGLLGPLETVDPHGPWLLSMSRVVHLKEVPTVSRSSRGPTVSEMRIRSSRSPRSRGTNDREKTGPVEGLSFGGRAGGGKIGSVDD